MTRQLIMLKMRFLDTMEGRREHGATAVEYGLLVALIAAVIVGVVGLLGTQIEAKFQEVLTAIGG